MKTKIKKIKKINKGGDMKTKIKKTKKINKGAYVLISNTSGMDVNDMLACIYQNINEDNKRKIQSEVFQNEIVLKINNDELSVTTDLDYININTTNIQNELILDIILSIIKQ